MRIVILSLFGILFAYKLYQSTQEVFFFDGIIMFVIAFIGLLIFVFTIFKNIKEYELSQDWSSFFPTFVGLFFILSNVGLNYYIGVKMNSPTLIRGFYDGDFNGFSVDFKSNGSYIMANGSGLGESYFYGNYTLKDSIITLDKSNIDNCIKTNILVIRKEQYTPDDSNYKKEIKYIIQIDNKGKEIINELSFRVTIDNRTNK